MPDLPSLADVKVLGGRLEETVVEAVRGGAGLTGDFSHLIISNPVYGIITLSGFEIPNQFPLGGDQRCVVNQYIGVNRREVQILGAQPRPLAWRGAFLYTSAVRRAKYFDLIRQSGQPVTVQWGDFVFTAVIEQFYYNPINQFHIPYAIQLQVIAPQIKVDDLAKGLPPTSLDSPDNTIFNILAGIQTIVARVRDFKYAFTTNQQGRMNAIIGAVANLAGTLGIPQAISSIVPSALGQYITQARGLAVIASSLATELSNSRASGAPSGELFQIGADATILANTLGQFSSPVASLSQTLVSGNLFRIAQTFYHGIDGVWDALADANHLTDAKLVGPQTVQLIPINGKAPDPTAVNTNTGTSYEIPTASVPKPVDG